MSPKITPKDFFLHLGAAVALYAAAGALINLALRIIDYSFPDKLAGYFTSSSIAWPISMLVILVPILYVLEWTINRDAARFPEKKDLWIRRWRIYLTLFLTVVLIGGDLIAMINVYLSGEITMRFFYKVLVILLVAGVVGKYYLSSIAENMRWSKVINKVDPWVGIALVLVAIVGGFLIVGSPAKQRAIRFDNQRTNDLQTIQWQVISYWQQKSLLPADLAALNDDLSGFIVPTDPDTDAPYEYSVKSANVPTNSAMPTFQLCATFDLATQDLKGRGEYGYGRGGIGISYDMAYPYPGGENETWKHEAGRTCFDRIIDPDKYPIIEKTLRSAAY